MQRRIKIIERSTDSFGIIVETPGGFELPYIISPNRERPDSLSEEIIEDLGGLTPRQEPEIRDSRQLLVDSEVEASLPEQVASAACSKLVEAKG